LEWSVLTTSNFDRSTSDFLSIMLKVSAMRIHLAVTIISIAMLASPLAYGQAASGKGQIGTQGTSGKPSGPAVGSGDGTLIPPTQPAVAPPSDALSNLAGRRLRRPQLCASWDAVEKIDTASRDPRAAGASAHGALASNTLQPGLAQLNGVP
jgi:hypothetical protein